MADPHNPPSDDDTLERLLEQVLDLHEQGGMASVERAIESHPAHADALRRHVERLRGLGLLTDDASTSRAAPASFPERLGDFRLIQRLGGGGMGVVYLAEQISLARRVALKLIRPEHLWFDGARDRFKREVEAIARLQHPGIVPVYAAGEDQGVPWMAMEFVGGATLDDAMRELDGARPDRLAGNDLDRTIAKVAHSKDSASTTNATRGAFADESWTSACARIVREVARALEHAHRRGVLHRDVKPANIVLTQDGRAQLLDFGLAAAQGASRLTASQSSLGSPAYMSPEQVRGERDLDARTDVYSLGLTLYELLTLHAPFAVDSAEEARKLVLDGATPPMRARNASVPRDLAIVCKKAIAPDRRDRYASAQEFAADLDNVLASRPIHASPPGALRRAQRWTRRHPARAIALLAAILLLFVAPSVFLVQQSLANARIQTALDSARRDRDRGREAVAVLLQEVANEELFELPRMQGVRERLLLSARDFHERFLADGQDEPDAVAQAADSGLQVATLSSELGRTTEALAAADRAVALAERATEHGAADLDDGILRAKAITLRGKLRQQLGDAESARADLDRASALLQTIAAKDAVRAAKHVISVEQARAFLLRQENDAALAAECQRALDSAWEAIRDVDTTRSDRRDAFERYFVASCDRAALLAQQGMVEDATRQLARCDELSAAEIETANRSAVVRRHRSRIETLRAAIAQRSGDLDEAERRYRAAIAGYEALLEEQPDSATVLRLLANAQNNLAVMLRRDEGRRSEHRALLEASIAKLRRLVTADPSVLENRVDLGAGIVNLASLRADEGDAEAAFSMLVDARADIEHAVAEDPQRAVWQDQLHAVVWHQALAAGTLRDHRSQRECAARIASLRPEVAESQRLAAQLVSASIASVLEDASLTAQERADLGKQTAAQGMAWLRKAAELGCADYELVRDSEAFDPLRDAEGFDETLAKIGENHRRQQTGVAK